MDKLESVIVYLCQNYPHKEELSNARVTKMVYLADWLSAENLGKQITDIRWYFNHYGPYVDDVIEVAKTNTDFLRVEESVTAYGTPKTLIRSVSSVEVPLPDAEKAILDKIIKDTSPLTWNPFIKYVYETYPIRSADRYEALDLVDLAKRETATTESALE